MSGQGPAERPVTYHGASSPGRSWLQARDRWEELDGRHHLARAEAALKARGEWDPARFGAGGAVPLTLAEHLEVLANGEVVSRVYRHPYLVHWALEAGATWQQIAEAAGTSEAEVRQEYRDLAEGQHRLWESTGHRFGMDDAEYAAALERAGRPPAPLTGAGRQLLAQVLADAAEPYMQTSMACPACLAADRAQTGAGVCRQHPYIAERLAAIDRLAERLAALSGVAR